MSNLDHLVYVDPSLGNVVVTRFECLRMFDLLRFLLLHHKVKKDVKRSASGFIGVKTLIDWRQRVVLSISLWDDLESIYSMGAVEQHILATRRIGDLGISTTSGIFAFVGDWRRVLFRSPCVARSPLRSLRSSSLTQVKATGGGHAHSY